MRKGKHSGRYRPGIALLLAISLVACSSGVISSEQGYVLVQHQTGRLQVVPTDDPHQEAFDALRDVDPFVDEWIDVFEHTTLAFISTNMRAPHPQAVRNHLILVADSEAFGLQTDIEIHVAQQRVPVELAVGLGHNGQPDWEAVRLDWGRAMAPILLAMTGWPVKEADATEDRAALALYELYPERALELGFGAALDALHAEASPDLLRTSRDANVVSQERLARYQGVPENAFRWQYVKGQPTAEIRSRTQAMQTPGVVATFIYRLLHQTGIGYPQRYMLWFAEDYDPDEVTYGKLMLALARAPKGRRALQEPGGQVQVFIDSYCETFVSEEVSVRRLVDQVFGIE